MSCKHKNKIIIGKCYTDDEHKFDFGIGLEENTEYTEYDIEDMVDKYIKEIEDKNDVIVGNKNYSVVCVKCKVEIEI